MAWGLAQVLFIFFGLSEGKQNSVETWRSCLGEKAGPAKPKALAPTSKAVDPKAVAKVSRRAQQREAGVFKRRGGL